MAERLSPWDVLADPSLASKPELDAALRCVAALHAEAAGVLAPTDLLFLLVITAPLLLTPDLIGRAIAWRAPGPGLAPPPPLDRPADETWHLLCTWRLAHTNPNSPEARRALAWIFGSGTTETPAAWASDHPRVARVAYEILDAGADRAAAALGLGEDRVASLAALLARAGPGAPLPVDEALSAHRDEILGGRLYGALRLLLDTAPADALERAAVAVAEAEVLRRLGLLDIADARLASAEGGLVNEPPAARRPLEAAIAVTQGRLALSSEGLPETCKNLTDRASRLVWALAARPRAADVVLSALRQDEEPWDLADQFRFSWSAAWLATQGWMGSAWDQMRQDAMEWRTEDPALAGLWQRLARRQRPTSEDLRAWLERCPV